MLAKTIIEGPARRILSLAGAACVAAAATSVSPAASADVTYLYASSSIDRLAPDHLVKLTVKARSADGVKAVHAILHYRTPQGEPYDTIDSFTLQQGTEQDGTWEAVYKPDIEAHPGQTVVEITADSNVGLSKSSMTGFMACYTTSFSELSVTPSTVDIDHRDVTVVGRAEYQVSRDTAPQPAAGMEVGQYVNGPKVITDADGRFTFGAVASDNVITEILPGQSPICKYAKGKILTVNTQETEISARLIAPPQPFAIGTEVAIEGTVLRRSAGGLVPADGEDVDAVMDLNTDTPVSLAGMTTDANGHFRIAFPAPRAGQLTVRAYGNVFLVKSDLSLGFLDVRLSSSVPSFDASPEPVGKGFLVTARGRVVSTDGNGTDVLAGVNAALEFSADGKSGWSRVGTAPTNQFGDFIVQAPASSDGYWRIRYDGDAAHLPSVSGSDYVDVKYQTAIKSFNASPEPVVKGKTITVSGTLQRYVSAWGPLGGKTVYLYFRPYKATAWSYMGVATSDRYGEWRKGFKAVRDGTWYAKYKGSDTYLAVTSGGDYVDVR